MTRHGNGSRSFLTAALFAGTCLAGLGLVTAQDPQPERSDEPAPAKDEDRRQALPLKKVLPSLQLGEVTAEEGQVSIQRPVAQKHLQVIYLFSCGSVEDNSWIERAMKADRAGARTTLEHMQRLSELQTFQDRVLWTAIAVPGYPKTSLAAGYAPQDGVQTQEDEQVAPVEPAPMSSAARKLAARKFLRKLKGQTGAEFPFLMDPDGKLVSALAIPSNLLLIVDSKGVIQFAATERHSMQVGDSSKNVADSDYLRRALNELLDGRAEVSAPYGKNPTLQRPKANDGR